MHNLISKLQNLQNFINNDVFDVVGVEAEKFYRKSFEDEGFTDQAFQKWDNVQRKLRPARTERAKTLKGYKILTNSGDLKESVKYEIRKPNVVIHSDKDYAQVHNEGGKSGRAGREFNMKQRKFIGKSATLNQILSEQIARRLKNIK